MTREEKLIRAALAEARNKGASFGKGGQAAAKIYREGAIDPEDMLYAIAVLANWNVETLLETR